MNINKITLLDKFITLECRYYNRLENNTLINKHIYQINQRYNDEYIKNGLLAYFHNIIILYNFNQVSVYWFNTKDARYELELLFNRTYDMKQCEWDEISGNTSVLFGIRDTVIEYKQFILDFDIIILRRTNTKAKKIKGYKFSIEDNKNVLIVSIKSQHNYIVTDNRVYRVNKICLSIGIERIYQNFIAVYRDRYYFFNNDLEKLIGGYDDIKEIRVMIISYKDIKDQVLLAYNGYEYLIYNYKGKLIGQTRYFRKTVDTDIQVNLKNYTLTIKDNHNNIVSKGSLMWGVSLE